MGSVPATAVSPPRLVADLGQEVLPNAGSKPHGFASLPGGVVFAAQPDDHADRLFVTDGSSAGTRELTAICPLRVAGTAALLFSDEARAFYRVLCADGSVAFWGTDGSVAGTRPLLVLAEPGSGADQDAGGIEANPEAWCELGGETFFLLGGRAVPLELWKTDGTLAGTTLVRELEEVSGETYSGLCATVGGQLVLAAYAASWLGEWEVLFWKSDGTTSGTRLGRRIPTGAAGFSFPRLGRLDAGIALWMKGENDSTSEFWLSDGSDAGTTQLAVFHAQTSWIDALAGWKADGRSLYFIATSDGRRSVWRSDLTPESTRPIMDVTGWHAYGTNLVVLDDNLLVLRCAGGNSTDCEFWRAPKSGGPGEPVPGGCGAAPCDPIADGGSISRFGDRVVFRTSTAERSALWISDGSDAPAEQLALLCDEGDCWRQYFTLLSSDGDYVFATSQEWRPPYDLWISDGTPVGTLRVAHALDDLALGLADAGPFLASVADSGWVFRASGGGLGLELRRAERRHDSAALLADLRLDRPGLTAASALGEVDGGHIFAILGDLGRTTVVRRSADGAIVDELFSLPPLYEDSPEMQKLRFYPAGEDWLFFAGNPYDYSSTYGSAYQLYRLRPATHELFPLFAEPSEAGVGATLSDDLLATTDGYLFLGTTINNLTPSIYRWRPGSSNVEVVGSLPASTASSAGSNAGKWFVQEDSCRLVAIDLGTLQREVLVESSEECWMKVYALEFGTIVLVQSDYSETGSVLQLWRTDGKASGTAFVTQIPWSEHFWCSSGFAVSPGFAQGAALFELAEWCGGTQHLWTSDGSPERTRLLFASSSWYPMIARAARFRGAHYFLVEELDPGEDRYRWALWQSDGTPTGSRRAIWLPDHPPGGANFSLELAAGASALYFPWPDTEHGLELWRSDGTAEGTWPVADLEPGAGSSSPSELIAVGDQVLFTATTAAAGRELWQVDGASPQPELVSDLYPGPESSAPLWVSGSRESAFFQADDGVVGREIWEVDRPSVAPCVADATTLCLANGRFRARAVRRDFAGELGAAGVVPLTGDSGYFWFFAPGNPEVLLKIVDACGLPGFENFWAYSTGLTNVEVELEVVDTASGERKVVRTALGEAYGPLFDSGSFQVCAEGGASARTLNPPVPAAGATSLTVLPLLDGRFEARASWRKRDGTTGVAAAVPLAADSGFFWFFDPAIVEVLVKMVDACGEGGFDNFWVFAGGLTDVEVHLEVTDTWSGEVVRHDNLQGQPFSTLLETGKLRVCEAVP